MTFVQKNSKVLFIRVIVSFQNESEVYKKGVFIFVIYFFLQILF